jgi:beta-glucosidase
MKCKQLIFTGFFTLIITNTINAQNKPHLDKSKPIEERIDLLMQQMTIYEISMI